MNRNRTVAGLDVHKDSIYLCIMGHDEAIIFEKTYGVPRLFHLRFRLIIEKCVIL